ncbi:hypothetical protein NIIDMKKI_79190 [Mycobacterium kansasii]|uniref:Uncharacterized protein n=1 Tax=Mycobacterium kansasii TaxID=1768 RepID=A0A7G1ISM6_MYCKA|nr:hypothetical protein NIIDMKKI_79190 [Mycobacterium kansasii]
MPARPAQADEQAIGVAAGTTGPARPAGRCAAGPTGPADRDECAAGASGPAGPAIPGSAGGSTRPAGPAATPQPPTGTAIAA